MLLSPAKNKDSKKKRKKKKKNYSMKKQSKLTWNISYDVHFRVLKGFDEDN